LYATIFSLSLRDTILVTIPYSVVLELHVVSRRRRRRRPRTASARNLSKVATQGSKETYLTLHNLMVGVICAPLSVANCLYHARTRTNHGDRSFAVNSPVVWNSLPAELRLDIPLSAFRKTLNTFLVT